MSKHIYKSYIKKMSPMDEFDTEKLILEVQKQPCIWDVNSKTYNLKSIRNREIRKQAWEEIGRNFYPDWEELTLEDRQKKNSAIMETELATIERGALPVMSAEALSKKWVNIRKYYTDEVRKPINGPPKKRQRTYHHLLTFLDDTVNKRRVPRIKEFQDIGKQKVDANNSSDSEPGELYIVEDVDELKHIAPKRMDPPVIPALLDKKNVPDPYLEVKRETDHGLGLWDKPASPKPQIQNKTSKVYQNPEIMKLLNETPDPTSNNNSFLYFPPARPVENSIISRSLRFDQSEEASKRFLLSLLPEIMALSLKQNLQFRLGIMDLLNDIKLNVKPDANPKVFPNSN